jgi:ElaB/YqjD/DUF883 family membrane-anchored ribosome-binding protein
MARSGNSIKLGLNRAPSVPESERHRAGRRFIERSSTMTDISREQLAGDVRQVIDDAQALLSQAARATGQQAHDLRARAGEELRRAQSRLADLEHKVADRSRAAIHATDDWVHTHPWGAIGLAAGVGFLVGLLASRR